MLDTARSRDAIRSELEARLAALRASPEPPEGLFTVMAEQTGMVLVDAYPGWRLAPFPASDAAPSYFRTARVRLGEDLMAGFRERLGRRSDTTLGLVSCRDARLRAMQEVLCTLRLLDAPLPAPAA